MLFLVTIATFGAVTLLVIGLTMRTERDMVNERMDRQARGLSATGPLDAQVDAPFKERVVLPFLRNLAAFSSKMTPSGAYQGIEEKLDTAGRPWNLGAREFVGLKVLSIAVCTALGLAASTFFADDPLLRLLFIILFIFMGVMLPEYALQSVINTRQSNIRRGLSDALDLLTVSVEAGLGLDGAMQRVVEKFHNPLSDEMSRALQEMQVGKLRAVALKDMAKRAKVDELTSFVAAICQADQLGVSIAKVLRVQGETLRMLRGQRARELGAKLPVKMLFPLVFCIFPAIFVVMLAPAAISIARAFGMIK